MEEETRLMKYDTMTAQHVNNLEVSSSSTDDEFQGARVQENFPQSVLDEKTLMSLEREAMYPTPVQPWMYENIDWTSDSNSVSLVNKGKRTWSLKKQRWKPKIKPTKMCDHFTRICFGNYKSQYQQQYISKKKPSSDAEHLRKDKKANDRKKENEKRLQKKEDPTVLPIDCVNEAKGKILSHMLKQISDSYEPPNNCEGWESECEDRGKFLVVGEEDNRSIRETLNMGQSIISIPSVVNPPRSTHTPKCIPNRRKLTKSFALPNLGIMSSFRSTKIWDSDATQSVESRNSEKRSKHSCRSITSFDKYFKGFHVPKVTRGKRYCSRTLDASSSETTQGNTPGSRRFLRNSPRTIELVEENIWEISDLGSSDNEETTKVERESGKRMNWMNVVGGELKTKKFQTLSIVCEALGGVTSFQHVHKQVRATNWKAIKSCNNGKLGSAILSISKASFNHQFGKNPSMTNTAEYEEEQANWNPSSISSKLGSSSSLECWSEQSSKGENKKYSLLRDGDEVQEVEVVGVEEQEEDLQVENDESEENEQHEDVLDLPKKYIPVYFTPGTKATVATSQGLLYKIKTIYNEAAYEMSEALLQSLEDESKGHLRVYINQLHHLMQGDITEIDTRRKAICETEEMYAWKKENILQTLLEISAKMGKDYETQQVSNFRTHSVDYLQSMVGLAEIELQKLEMKKEVENVTSVTKKENFNLFNNLEVNTNMP